MKKDLVLLHGALGSGAQLEETLKKLQETFNVHVYELPGHGKRAAEVTSFSIDGFSNALHAWIKQNFTNKVTLFGYSMGGYIGLHLAVTHPQLFERIITLGTKFSWTAEAAAKETSKLDVQLLEQKVPQYCSYLESLHAAYWKQVVKNTAALMLELGNRPLLHEKSCAQIKVPVTLMLGELDKMVTREETELVAGFINGSTYKILPGFVHPLERLDAHQLAEIITTTALH